MLREITVFIWITHQEHAAGQQRGLPFAINFALYLYAGSLRLGNPDGIGIALDLSGRE